MSDWDDQARELGVSNNTILGWAPGESKRFVKEYWRLRTQPDPHAGDYRHESYYDFDLSRWVMQENPHG